MATILLNDILFTRRRSTKLIRCELSFFIYNMHLFFLFLFFFLIVIIHPLCVSAVQTSTTPPYISKYKRKATASSNANMWNAKKSDLWPVTTLNKVLKSRPSITHRFLFHSSRLSSPPCNGKNPTRWILMQFALVSWKTSSILRRVEFRA